MTHHADAVVFSGAGQPLRFMQVEAPEPTGAEILVRITACTLCGSDVHTFEGRRAAPTPTVLGHEILGRIEAFGPSAPRRDFTGQDLNIGDRVTWSIVTRCGDCFYCRRGLPQKCERMHKYGHEPLRPGRELSGGLASLCLLVSGTAILRTPERLPDEVVCPANCATATVAAALAAAGDVRNRSVLVMGAGMLGLTACAMARSLGAEAVIACDSNADRLERAATFGCTHRATPNELASFAAEVSASHGVDVVLELSGNPAALENAWPHVRMGGLIVLVGSVFPSRPVPVLLEQVVRRQLTLRGIHNYAPEHLAQALAFLERSDFPFASLITHWLPLAEAERAFELARSPAVLRVGVYPG